MRRFVILIGNAGPDMFRRFARERDPVPRHAWTTGRATSSALSPRIFDAQRRLPLRQARPGPSSPGRGAAGAGHVSPLGLNIHPTYGLWHAYRAALLFPVEFDIAQQSPGAHPCETCADKPCLTACPVDAFDGTSYDVPACAATSGNAGRAKTA